MRNSNRGDFLTQTTGDKKDNRRMPEKDWKIRNWQKCRTLCSEKITLRVKVT